VDRGEGSATAPALDPARSGEGAGVVDAGCDRTHPACKPGDVTRGVPFGGRAVAELTVFVDAPALGPARSGEGAGVVAAGCDRAGPGCKPGGVARGAPRAAGPVAGGAGGVAAPALDPARSGEGAGVEVAGCDRTHPACKTREVDRGVPVGDRAVAELAPVVRAPALDPARARQRAGVLEAGGDGRGGGARGRNHRSARGARASRRHGD